MAKKKTSPSGEFQKFIEFLNKLNLKDYSLAVFYTVAALILKLALIQLIHWPEASSLLFMGAIMISALQGGFGPGIVASILSLLLSDYFFLEPGTLFINSTSDQVLLITFGIEAFVICWICRALHLSRKKVQESLNRVNRSEQFFRSLIENVKDYAIFTVNKRGQITSWNKGVEVITGYSEIEVLGKNYTKIFMTNQTRGSNSKKLQKILRIAKKRGRYEFEDWKQAKSGKKFWADIIFTYLTDEVDEISYFAVIIRDLSEKKKIEDLKTDFLSILAHELNTPITTAKIITETFLRNVKRASGRLREWDQIDDIDHELNRVVNLVKDLLDISRIDANKLVLQKKNLDLASLVKDVVRKMNINYQDTKIISQQLSSAQVIVDPDRLEQVMINLINNAINYSPKNSFIEIASQKTKGRVVVSVKDQGGGIPKNSLPFIFDRYYQAQEKPQRGFGLGLYISKQIIQKHKGLLWVDSTEGQGSTFYFSLPTTES